MDVQRALAKLALRDRQLLWLAHVEGASHREVAAALGLGVASVRVLLFRARRRLAAHLGGAERSTR
jgi:RNA polymerase sigma-70 factor (ECF subfamily)